ncbi:MAG: hypothetical protein CSB33_01410 [Desulfobacterales bacterium]|nr:MAG: hypothetical protein CSB33_01410 [Desulfobacterales bacterium]
MKSSRCLWPAAGFITGPAAGPAIGMAFLLFLGGCAVSDGPAAGRAKEASVTEAAASRRTPSARQFSVTASSLRIRKGPGMDYPVMGKLVRGAKIRIFSRDGKWGFTGTGWMHMDHLTPVFSPRPLKSPRSLKQRPLPGRAVPPAGDASSLRPFRKKSRTKKPEHLRPAVEGAGISAIRSPAAPLLRTAPPDPAFSRIRMEFAVVKKKPKPAHLEAFILNYADHPQAAELVDEARAIYKSLILETP